ncbi:DUF4350 domain-containing protein [Nostocoides sp. Soil756]|jgi:hypothetical protein|uniref:DUF4350 domain-containing protein n=1 Tax=Nostocoides sp. Soil756 TaxID=1736399 RepID=UPI0006F78915|nr:DUF4350 domain-containing protein [Tetrasphaera sp. Soil756]KRE62179.1 hypothetical protein ASG78_03765 [Tetrasphaera sp. Soil756]
MSATVTDRTVAPAGTELAAVVRRGRGVLLWVLLLLVGGAVIAFAAGSPSPEEYLHPDGTGQGGTLALVSVLGERGIDVRVVETSADAVRAAGEGTGTTIVIGNADLLTDTAARRLLHGARGVDRIVVLDASPRTVELLGLDVSVRGVDQEPTAPECSSPWVRPDDRVSRVSWLLVPDGLVRDTTGCYPASAPGAGDGPDALAPTGYAALELPADGTHPAMTLVGFPDAATNRFVTEAQNAGLMVRLLGASPRLVWYHPGVDDVTANPSQRPTGSPWPAWAGPALVLVGIAFVAFALARGRRLGRLVPEPLPVVVRASETTESRAELYRAADDRGRAARILRHATTGRLAHRLGLGPATPLDALVDAVARATALPPAQIDAVLRDGPTPDEAGLVALAQQLAHLEEKVARHD